MRSCSPVIHGPELCKVCDFVDKLAFSSQYFTIWPNYTKNWLKAGTFCMNIGADFIICRAKGLRLSGSGLWNNSELHFSVES
jgi:hypothetical protein